LNNQLFQKSGKQIQKNGVTHPKTNTVKSTCPSKFYQSRALEPLLTNVFINGREVEVEIDTGASIPLMSFSQFQRLFPSVMLETPKIRVSNISAPIQLKGSCVVEVNLSGKSAQKLELFVSENPKEFSTLLGRNWLEALVPDWRERFGIVTNQVTADFSTIDIDNDKFVELLKSRFEKVFTIDGKQTIQGFEAHILLKDDAVPIFHKAYPVPFALRASIDDEIESS